MKPLIAMFMTVFLAELGDKTQIATLLFAAGGEHHPVAVFLVAAAALVLAAGCAVVIGTLAQRHIEGLPLDLVAGIGFVALGLWSIWGHFRA